MKKLLLATSIFVLSTAGFAFPPRPSQCPSAASITSAGLNSNVAGKDQDGLWAVGMLKNQYDTKDVWTFAVGRIQATDQADAYRKATASLSSLKFKQGPAAIQRLGRWGCAYTTDAGYVAISVTPSLEGIGITNAFSH